MTTTDTSSSTNAGGFAGDPAEAFRPPSAGGCCGSAPAAVSVTLGDAGAGTCCGSTEDARAAGSCCAPEAKAEAVAAGAGCCG